MNMGERSEKLLHVALLLLLISPPPAESFIFTAIMSAVSFAYQAYQIINDAHDTYKKFAPQTTLDDVLNQGKQVEAKVDQIGLQLSQQLNQAVSTIITEIDHMNNIREGLNKLADGIRKIDNLHRLFGMYTSKRIRLNNHTLQMYINQVTTLAPNGPIEILNNIHELIIPTSGLKQSLLYYLKKDAPTNDTNTCAIGTPARGTFYQIFRLIAVVEIKAFTILAFAYSLDQVYKCESFVGEIDYATYQLQQRIMDYFEVFSELIDSTASSVRSCDPPGGWIQNENFYEFDRFITEYIVSAKSFFKYSSYCHSKPSCGKEIEVKTVDTCNFDFGCHENTRCKGHVDECFATNPISVCELEPWGKRYQYLQTKRASYGNSTGGCPGNLVSISEKMDCDICWCVCTEDSYESYTLRTFSSREQISDFKNNKAVTGVKFVVKENMTHIQIQEGVVLSEGKIQQKSLEWKPLENIIYDREETLKRRTLIYYILHDDGSKEELKENKDHLSFTKQSHIIYLDDLKAPIDYVVTGVRFGTPGPDNKGKSPIQLEIHVSPFDFDSGAITVTDDNPSMWLTPADMVGRDKEYDRERIDYDWGKPISPLLEPGTIAPRPSANTEIQIQNTMAKLDAGQTIIPLLDGQEVVGRPPFAAGGISLYFKSVSEGGGGFIGLRLWELDSMQYLHIDRLNQYLEKLSENVTGFKGCNDNISN